MNTKFYRNHYCQKKHRTYKTLAKCLWKRAVWVTGEGPFALLAAWCRDLTITLHEDMDQAIRSKEIIDYMGCGGACTRRHEIIRLASPDKAVPQDEPRRS